MESLITSEYGAPAAYILANEAASGSQGLERYLEYAPISREDVDEFAHLSPNSGEPEQIQQRADALWVGLTSMTKRINEYSVISAPRLGSLRKSLENYAIGMNNLYRYSAGVHFGENWTNDLVNYCLAFAHYKKEQLELSYAQSRPN